MCLQLFENIEDSRIDRTKLYPLTEILFSALVAVLCGATSWNMIAFVAKERLAFLRNYLPFANGIPSHDTYGRVFGALRPEFLEKFYREFVKTIIRFVKDKEDIISIDGKCLKNAKPEDSKQLLYLVSAWSNNHNLSLCQTKVQDKSNEITAVPLILQYLDIKNKIVTMDAMGTQTRHAEIIDSNGGIYVLPIKGNQGSAQIDLKQSFDKLDYSDTYSEIDW